MLILIKLSKYKFKDLLVKRKETLLRKYPKPPPVIQTIKVKFFKYPGNKIK